MNSAYRLLISHIEKTLQFEFHAGDVSTVTFPHTTGWRTLHSLVLSYITGYSAIIQRKTLPDITVHENETLCLCPGVTHRVEMTTRKPGISRWVHVNYTILGGMDIFTVLAPPAVIKGSSARRIGEFNEALAHLHKQTEMSLNDILREKSITASLLSIIADSSKIRTEALPFLQESDRIAPVLEYIRKYIKTDLQRELLARIAGLSSSRFDVLFKSVLGMTPMNYVHMLRLKEAQRLLLNSTFSIKEIACAIGHDDPFHFSRVFKQHYNLSPQMFRQQAGDRII